MAIIRAPPMLFVYRSSGSTLVETPRPLDL